MWTVFAGDKGRSYVHRLAHWKNKCEATSKVENERDIHTMYIYLHANKKY